MRAKYVFKINGLPKDSEFNRMPFGRQIELRDKFAAFKATAKSTHWRCKNKTTMAGFREFKNLYQPKQWFFIDRDGPMYHDDSFEVWYA